MASAPAQNATGTASAVARVARRLRQSPYKRRSAAADARGGKQAHKIKYRGVSLSAIVSETWRNIWRENAMKYISWRRRLAWLALSINTYRRWRLTKAWLCVAERRGGGSVKAGQLQSACGGVSEAFYCGSSGWRLRGKLSWQLWLASGCGLLADYIMAGCRICAASAAGYWRPKWLRESNVVSSSWRSTGMQRLPAMTSWPRRGQLACHEMYQESAKTAAAACVAAGISSGGASRHCYALPPRQTRSAAGAAR